MSFHYNIDQSPLGELGPDPKLLRRGMNSRVHIQLSEISDIYAGYPFRESLEEAPEGGVNVVQVQNTDPDRGIDWKSLIKVNLKGRRKPDWLRDGDVLFANKGYWHKAVLVEGAPAETVCVPLFFHVRINRPDLVRPDYLAWSINQAPAQAYINENARGSGTRAVRRDVIEQLPIWLPSMALQAQVMGLRELVEEEARVLEDLAINRKKEFAYIVNRILHGVIQ